MKKEMKRVRRKIPNSKLIHNSMKGTMEVKVPLMLMSQTSPRPMMMTTMMEKMIMTVKTAKLKVGMPCTKELLKMTRRRPKEDSRSLKKRVETDDPHREEDEIIVTIIIH